MNAVAGVDGESNFGGFLTRKMPKSTYHTNEEEEVLLTSRIHYLHTLLLNPGTSSQSGERSIKWLIWLVCREPLTWHVYPCKSIFSVAYNMHASLNRVSLIVYV